jgi:hypothetical protein
VARINLGPSDHRRGARRHVRQVGRQCSLSYPTCTMRDMSQPSAHRHHAIDYVELTVSDLEQAKRFYTQAFGWRFNDYGPEYALLRVTACV